MYTIKLNKNNNTISIRTVKRDIKLIQTGRHGSQGIQGEPGLIQSIVPGTNVMVDSTDPANPVVSSTGGGAIASVNGQTGIVVLDASDVGADTAGSAATAQSNANSYTDNAINTINYPVDSVNGQTGTVALDADDISDSATVNKYVTTAEKTKLSNLSGVNTGDQDLSGLVPITRTVNGSSLASNITLTQDSVGDGTTNKQYSVTDKTKVSNITVTQPVNLDTMESDISGKQPIDSDLTAIAGLTPANDDIIQRKSGAWTNRTISQVKTDLALTKSDVGLDNVDNTSDATKNSAVATLANKTLTTPTISSTGFTNAQHAHTNAASGGQLTDAALSSPVSVTKGGTGRNTGGAAYSIQTAGTTSTGAHQSIATGTTGQILKSNGSAALPTFQTGTGSDVGLGNVDNTSNATERAATATLTNKRVTPRTGTATSSATPTINTDNVDYYSLTAQAVDITSFTTNLSGTPTTGQKLWISITGTAARAITWGASFEASTIALPTTTVLTNRLDVGFIYTGSIWRCVGVA